MRGFCALRDVSPSISSRPAIYLAAHCSVEREVESTGEDMVRPAINDDLPEKAVAGFLFVMHMYRQNQFLLTIFQVKKVQNSDCVALQKQEDQLLESLEATEHYYCAEIMALPPQAFATLGAVSADGLLQHRRKTSFLEDKFRLAVSKAVTAASAFRSLLPLDCRAPKGTGNPFK